MPPSSITASVAPRAPISAAISGVVGPRGIAEAASPSASKRVEVTVELTSVRRDETSGRSMSGVLERERRVPVVARTDRDVARESTLLNAGAHRVA